MDEIYNEDCLIGLQRIDSVDLVCTDIPYNEVNRDDNGLRNLNKKGADVGEFNVIDLASDKVNPYKAVLFADDVIATLKKPQEEPKKGQ